jgi:hypothetical protein
MLIHRPKPILPGRQHAPLKINVAPAQPQHLALAQTQSKSCSPPGAVRRTVSRIKDPPHTSSNRVGLYLLHFYPRRLSQRSSILRHMA